MTVFLAHGVAEDKDEKMKKSNETLDLSYAPCPKSNAVSYKYKMKENVLD